MAAVVVAVAKAEALLLWMLLLLLMAIELMATLFWDDEAETTNSGDADDGDGVIVARMSMAAGGVRGEEVAFCTQGE